MLELGVKIFFFGCTRSVATLETITHTHTVGHILAMCVCVCRERYKSVAVVRGPAAPGACSIIILGIVDASVHAGTVEVEKACTGSAGQTAHSTHGTNSHFSHLLSALTTLCLALLHSTLLCIIFFFTPRSLSLYPTRFGAFACVPLLFCCWHSLILRSSGDSLTLTHTHTHIYFISSSSCAHTHTIFLCVILRRCVLLFGATIGITFYNSTPVRVCVFCLCHRKFSLCLSFCLCMPYMYIICRYLSSVAATQLSNLPHIYSF